MLSDLIKQCGISPSLRGYHYLKSAIKLGLADRTIFISVTKTLYPAIADEFNVTPNQVERCIRHAIESGWLRGDINTHMKIFGYSISSDKGKPTNAEFIKTLVEYITTVEKENRNR